MPPFKQGLHARQSPNRISRQISDVPASSRYRPTLDLASGEVGKPERVNHDTVFQIASLSKPISSTVVALVSDGIVSWESRITDLDLQFQLADPYPTREVTIRDLFADRSGLPGTAGDDLEEIGYATVRKSCGGCSHRPSSSFRSGYSYSNFGLTEGAVAARPMDKAWEDVAEQKLYRPLGMTSTSSLART